MWTADFDELLLEWADLRTQAASLPLGDALMLVHTWWNKAPIVNSTVHFADPDNWPLPWDLLAQNGYCDVAKCLGVIYTLILIDCDEIHSMVLLQTSNETYVQINETAYTLGPEIGIINSEINGPVLHQFDCAFLKNKLI